MTTTTDPKERSHVLVRRIVTGGRRPRVTVFAASGPHGMNSKELTELTNTMAIFTLEHFGVIEEGEAPLLKMLKDHPAVFYDKGCVELRFDDTLVEFLPATMFIAGKKKWVPIDTLRKKP